MSAHEPDGSLRDFIDTWNTTGEVLAIDDAAATVLSATDTYRWLQKRSISGATVRFNGEFASGGDQLIGLWELKSKKSGWQPWIKLRLVRA